MNTLEAHIYIRGELFRIVNLLDESQSSGLKGGGIVQNLYIDIRELGGEFTPLIEPEILSIPEMSERYETREGAIENFKLLKMPTIDGDSINDLIGQSKIEIDLISENRRYKMFHLYETKHPIHPWDTYDFFEYENDLRDFGRIIKCFVTSILAGQTIQIHFYSMPQNDHFQDSIDRWAKYREGRELLESDGIIYNLNTFGENLEQSENDD